MRPGLLSTQSGLEIGSPHWAQGLPRGKEPESNRAISNRAISNRATAHLPSMLFLFCMGQVCCRKRSLPSREILDRHCVICTTILHSRACDKTVVAQRKNGLLPPSLAELRRTGRRFASCNDGRGKFSSPWHRPPVRACAPHPACANEWSRCRRNRPSASHRCDRAVWSPHAACASRWLRSCTRPDVIDMGHGNGHRGCV